MECEEFARIFKINCTNWDHGMSSDSRTTGSSPTADTGMSPRQPKRRRGNDFKPVESPNLPPTPATSSNDHLSAFPFFGGNDFLVELIVAWACQSKI